jgi:NADH-quinone oxidoreductase subunit E
LLAEKYGSEIRAILSRYPEGEKHSTVMALLYLAQKEYGLITKGALIEVSALAGLDPSQVAGLAGFYSLFQDHPKGKRRIRICTDLSCSLRGADRFAADLCDNLGVRLGQTTPDGEFTVEAVSCLAGCDKSPVFQIQDREGVQYYESESADRPMTAARAMDILNKIKKEGSGVSP